MNLRHKSLIVLESVICGYLFDREKVCQVCKCASKKKLMDLGRIIGPLISRV